MNIKTCVSEHGNFAVHRFGTDGCCERCHAKKSKSPIYVRPVPVSTSVTSDGDQAKFLTRKFYELKGSPLSANSSSQKMLADGEEAFRELIDEHGTVLIDEVMLWALSVDPTQFYQQPHMTPNPRNFAKHFGKMLVSFRSYQKSAAKRGDQIGTCTCPRTDGIINKDAKGILYDGDCPNHGHDLIPFYTYRIWTSRGILTATPPPPRPPRYGETGFPEYVKSLKKVLPKPRKREEPPALKLPVSAKISDLGEI